MHGQSALIYLIPRFSPMNPQGLWSVAERGGGGGGGLEQ